MSELQHQKYLASCQVGELEAAMKVVQQAGKTIEGASDDAEEEVGSNECELPLEIWVHVLKF